jgi:hypothetical protein
MTSVIVQPCGEGEPMRRFTQMVDDPVVLRDHAAVIPQLILTS